MSSDTFGENTPVGEHLNALLLSLLLGVKLLAYKVWPCLKKKNASSFPKWLYWFLLPEAIYEHSYCSKFVTNTSYFPSFPFGHSNGYVVNSIIFTIKTSTGIYINVKRKLWEKIATWLDFQNNSAKVYCIPTTFWDTVLHWLGI